MNEFILILILIIVVLIYLNLSLKIVPVVQAKSLFRTKSSKRYAEVDFIVPQLKSESYSLTGNFEYVNQDTTAGVLGLSRSFQVKGFCQVSELSMKSKFFEGNILVTSYENYPDILGTYDGDTVRFVVFDNSVFELEIKCSPASFDELKLQFSTNQDTTLRILHPYFKKQQAHQFLIGGIGVNINSINYSIGYNDSLYEGFLKQYQSSSNNIAHDSIYKAVSELMIIRRKSQTQLREEAVSHIE
ncbi:MAG: hypothetical protein NBV66_08210 [Burkholderiaceae bacterium]|nr:hypothetical protein [Burkholderiaceae bacterium]